jgi:hypothetical protein
MSEMWNEEFCHDLGNVFHRYRLISRTEWKSREDGKLLEFLSESSTMSQNLSEYGDRQSHRP